MAKLSTDKKRALEVIQKKISMGQSLLSKITEAADDSMFDQVLNETEKWKSSCYTVLKQILDDDGSYADEFKIQNKTICRDDNRLADLKISIGDSIQALEDIHYNISHNLFTPKKGMDLTFWQAIIITIITTIGGVTAGYFGKPSQHDSIPGLSKVSMEGTWEYACTSFDKTYQHGGRFIVKKDSQGNLYLRGERLWKDTLEQSTNKWWNVEGTTKWNTNWFFVVDDIKLYLEYELNDASGTKGYCTGFIDSDNNGAQGVEGNFYVLKGTPILNGGIIFKKISERDYFSFKPTLRTLNKAYTLK